MESRRDEIGNSLFMCNNYFAVPPHYVPITLETICSYPTRFSQVHIWHFYLLIVVELDVLFAEESS